VREKIPRNLQTSVYRYNNNTWPYVLKYNNIIFHIQKPRAGGVKLPLELFSYRSPSSPRRIVKRNSEMFLFQSIRFRV